MNGLFPPEESPPMMQNAPRAPEPVPRMRKQDIGIEMEYENGEPVSFVVLLFNR